MGPAATTSRPRYLRWRVAALVAVVLGYGWAGGGLRSFTWPAIVSASVGGLVVLVLAWQRQRVPMSRPVSRKGLVVWTAWLAAD
jgi:hypothetical protein